MNLKKFISGVSALTIAASAFVSFAVTASAYTPALSEDQTVDGYIVKAYYNISNENVDGMCPTEGDLRFRGNGYGFFNFGSGNREANVTMTVSAGDIMLVDFQDSQKRSSTVNSVSVGTKNDTLSESTGFLVYDITEDADTVKFNVGRAGCIISILVMEADPNVPVSSITVNYKAGDEIVYTDDTISAEGKHVGDELTIPYRRYVSKDGVLYEAARTSNAFTKSVAAAAETVVNISVTAVSVADGETFVAVVDGDGDSGNNADVRASYGSGKRGTLEIADVEPGIYKLVYNMYLRKQGNGPELFLDEKSLGLITAGTSWTTDVTFDNIEVTEAGTLSIANCDILDTVVLYKTGDIEPDIEISTSVTNAAAFTVADGYDKDVVAGEINLNVQNGSINLWNVTYNGNTPTNITGTDVPTAFSGSAIITIIINGATDTSALESVVFN